MKVNSKIASNAVILFLEWFSATVFSLVYVIIMGKILPTQEFGIVQTCFSIVGIVFLFTTLGLDIAMAKLIPEYQKDKRKTNKLIQYSTKIILVLNVIILISLLLGSRIIAPLISLPLNAFWMVIICISAFSIYTFPGEIIYGFQNMKKKFVTSFISNLIKVIISSVLIIIGFGYLGPLISFALGFGILGILRFEKSWFEKNDSEIDEKLVLNGYAIPVFIGTLATSLFITSQNIILNILKGPEITGIFSMGLTLIIPIWVIPSILSKALFPITSQLCLDKDKKKKQSSLMNLIIRYALLLTMPITIFLIVFSKRMILLMSQPSFLPASEFFPILAFGGIMYGFASLFHSNLYAIRKPKLNRNISIATSALFMLIVFPLTYFLSATGMAISYAFSTFFMSASSFYFLKKNLNLKIPLKDLGKIVLSSIIFFAIIQISHEFIISFLVKIGIALIAGILYLLALIPMNFYKESDVDIIRSFGKIFPKSFKIIINKICDILSKFAKKD